MLTDHTLENWVPSTDEEKAAVEEQLELLLQSPYFSSSKRLPDFLRFVVLQTLAGNADTLKERTIGIEVFHKKADYDTAAEPIVRVTAGEVRKRIAQYYQETGHTGKIRLVLPTGSYMPQFILPSATGKHSDSSTENAESAHETHPTPQHLDIPPPSWTVLLSTAALVLLGFAVYFGWHTLRPSGFTQFWEPLFTAEHPILFCVSDQNEYGTLILRDAEDPMHQNILKDHLVAVVIDDTIPLINIASLLQAHGYPYTVKGAGSTTFSDLRQGPNVFIGGYDNLWTLRLTKGLRYHFGNDPQMNKFWIADRNNPNNRTWMVDRDQQMSTNNYEDYALVARFIDSDAGHVAVVAAGIGRGGTIATGEFLTEPQYLDDLARHAPRGWSGRNIELVLATQVIGGRSGPPRVVASYFW